MRDLYRALGLSGIVADRRVIEGALEPGRVPSELREAGRFVLLDPTRKARYDWALSRVKDLSEVRSRLGLRPDPDLPMPSAGARPVPGFTSEGSGMALTQVRRLSWMGWGLGALLMAALIIGVGFRSTRRSQESLSSPTLASQGLGGDGNRPQGAAPSAGSSGDMVPIPPPDHGWLQLGSEVRPLVPWTIDTDPGQDYLLTLLDAKTQAVVMTLYLRGGESYGGLAPEGTFELTYSTGSQWFGFQHGFGAKAKVVRPALTYRVLAGSDGKGSWKLRLNSNSAEGIPSAPAAPQEAADPIPAVPGRSL